MTCPENEPEEGYTISFDCDVGLRSYLQQLEITAKRWNRMLPTEQDAIRRQYDAYSWQRARAEAGGGE